MAGFQGTRHPWSRQTDWGKKGEGSRHAHVVAKWRGRVRGSAPTARQSSSHFANSVRERGSASWYFAPPPAPLSNALCPCLHFRPTLGGIVSTLVEFFFFFGLHMFFLKKIFYLHSIRQHTTPSGALLLWEFSVLPGVPVTNARRPAPLFQSADRSASPFVSYFVVSLFRAQTARFTWTETSVLFIINWLLAEATT